MGKRNPDYFHFKQFSICQRQSAMKVGTDAVLIGSWTSVEGASRVLDIGTGTGVIALMLAQRNSDLRVIGIEIDEPSAREAAFNAGRSSWADRIGIRRGDFRELSPAAPFDLIVTNPPFYRPHERGIIRDAGRAEARQTVRLNHGELIEHSLRLLAPDGSLSLILPAGDAAAFVETAEKQGFFCRRLTRVCSLPGNPPLRFLMELRREPGLCDESRLVIEDRHHSYSQEMIKLTSAFYLKF